MVPSLPPEVFAHVFDALSWHPREIGYTPPPPYEDLLSCALVCKSFNAVATKELYRILEARPTNDSRDDDLDLDFHQLEDALLSNKSARESVRILCIADYESYRTDLLNSPIFEERLKRTLGILLACCSRLDLLEIMFFRLSITCTLVDLTGSWRPTLRRLKLWTFKDEDDPEPEVDLGVALGSVTAIRGLDINYEMQGDIVGPAPTNLTFLRLAGMACAFLWQYADDHTSALQYLVLHLDDLPQLWEYCNIPFSLYPSLVQVEITVSDLSDLVHLYRFLDPCQQVQHLRLSWSHIVRPPHLDEKAAAFTRLPQSLRLLDLRGLGSLRFSLCCALFREDWAPSCTVLVDDSAWKEKKRRGWEKQVEKRWMASSAKTTSVGAEQ